MSFHSPLPSSNYGFSVSEQNDVAITQTQVTSAISALDVAWHQTEPVTISKNTSANELTNPIFVNISNGTTALAIDSSGYITTNTTLTIPDSGILVTVNQPVTGLSVTVIDPVTLSIPASGIPVNVLTNEDIKPHINDYQTTAVTKSSSAAMTHTNTASANISTWIVGSDCDMKFSLIIGTTKMVARTSAAQRQVQIMFPTALLATGNVTVNVVNEDPGDNGVAFSVINGYEG